MNELLHFVIGSMVIVFFLLSFLRYRHLYQLLFAILTGYTFLIYLEVASSRAVQQILGVGAFLLLVGTLVAMFFVRRLEHKQLQQGSDEASAKRVC